MIKRFKPTQIKYVKDDGTETIRTIVSFTEVPENVKALDVSNMSESDRANILELVGEYQNYIQNHISTAFSFENWVQHTTGKSLNELKWRTFKIKNIQPIE